MLSWALLVLALLFAVVAYIITQGTRAVLAWRRAAAAGDLKVIRDIVEEAVNGWRSMKRPKEIPPDVWRGIQSMQVASVGRGFVRASCQAESEYRMAGGQWKETANPLQEGMAIAARAADMLFYEVAHFKPDQIQVDVYTAFRSADGMTMNMCILSMAADRDAARQVDWEEWSPAEIVDALGGRYQRGERGQPLPVEPQEPPAGLDVDTAALENGTGNGSTAAAHP